MPDEPKRDSGELLRKLMVEVWEEIGKTRDTFMELVQRLTAAETCLKAVKPSLAKAETMLDDYERRLRDVETKLGTLKVGQSLLDKCLKVVPIGLAIAFLIGLGGFFVRQEYLIRDIKAVGDDVAAMREPWTALTLDVVRLQMQAEIRESRRASREPGVSDGEPATDEAARARALKYQLPASRRKALK